MTSKQYAVQIVSHAEAAELLQKFKQGPENLNGRTSLLLAGVGVNLEGSFSLTARDAASGEVAWAHEGKNLITDFGRRVWADNRFSTAFLSFSPSTEVPQSGRYTLPSDVTQCFSSGGFAPTNAPATHTKTWATTFGTPGVTRTLGTIALCFASFDVNTGPKYIMAYALLTPPKTQTTTQTLEVVYKVSMNPIA